MLPATTVAPQVIGVARGATAATRRSMEGARTGRGIRVSCFWVESKRDAQIGGLCSAPAGDGKRLEPERATVESGFWL